MTQFSADVVHKTVSDILKMRLYQGAQKIRIEVKKEDGQITDKKGIKEYHIGV